MGKWYVYQCVFIAQLTIMMSSTCLSWPSPILSKLNKTDDNPLGRIITSTENSWLASLSTLGACFGATLFGFLSTYFGRKTLLIADALPFLVCYLWLAWAKNIWIFYVCRFFTGFGMGGAYSILPMYSLEMADVGNRGLFGTSMTVFMNIGQLIPYTVGAYMSFFWFHIILGSIPAFFIPLMFFFTSESPNYLMNKNAAEAESVLKKLRGRDDVSQNMKDIKDDTMNLSDRNVLEILKGKAFRKAVLIGVGGYTFTLLAGATLVSTYTQTIFELADTDIAPEMGSIIVAIVQLVATIIVSSIADKFPRKLLLTISFLGCTLVEIPFGLYFFLKDHNYDVTNVSWLPLVSLALFQIMYNIGLGPVFMALFAELFEMKAKGIGLPFLVIYSLGFITILTLLFNTLQDMLGLGILFWIFAANCVVGALFVRYIVIETKGKTFKEIQDKLNE